MLLVWVFGNVSLSKYEVFVSLLCLWHTMQNPSVAVQNGRCRPRNHRTQEFFTFLHCFCVEKKKT